MKVILHIGVGKTGTSTIQSFLRLNRHALAAQGFDYPGFLVRGQGRHLPLSAYVAEDADRTRSRIMLRIPEDDVPAFRAELEQEFQAHVEDCRARGLHTCILSDEGLSGLDQKSCLVRLKHLLERVFVSVEVILYLRRQDQLFVSRRSQRLKEGRMNLKALRKRRFFDFEPILDRWADVFGEDRVKPRIYERSSFPDGDVVPDFLAACGIDPMQEFERPGWRNPSLSPRAEIFLQHFFRLREAQAPKNPGGWEKRPSVVRYAMQLFPGSGSSLPRKAAQAFYADYEESNEAVRARWFPERETLFEEDFSSYPEQRLDDEMDREEFMTMAVALLDLMGADLRAEQKRQRYRTARLVELGAMTLEEAQMDERLMQQILEMGDDEPEVEAPKADAE
jgi:hypothetical protein